jgi:2-pyrone-4,6-dicarboxylate lactonase
VAALPPDSCDCHTHVFGPPERFKIWAPTNYEPPDSPFETHRAQMQAHGIDRAVLIQPIPYQTDNSAIADAVARSAGRYKGIGVLQATAGEAGVRSLQQAGFSGLRFNEMLNPNGQGRYAGAIGIEHLAPLAPALRACDMHAQIWARAPTCVELAHSLKPLGLPLVFDHMAGIDVALGLSDPSFQQLLRLLADGDIWIKLTVCRVSKTGPDDYEDVQPFHDAMVRANPERLLWGSDFPFVRMDDRRPSVAYLSRAFLDWTPPSLHNTLLVGNPKRLFGFELHKK